jgi:hypothetical protein
MLIVPAIAMNVKKRKITETTIDNNSNKRKKIDIDVYSNSPLKQVIKTADSFVLKTEIVNKNAVIYIGDNTIEKDTFIEDLNKMNNAYATPIRVPINTNSVRGRVRHRLPAFEAIRLTNAIINENINDVRAELTAPNNSLIQHYPLGSLLHEVITNKENLPKPFSSQQEWDSYKVPSAAMANGTLITKNEIKEVAIGLIRKSSDKNKAQKLKDLSNLK